jgi:MFS family permease
VVYLAELTDSAVVLGSVQFAAYLPAAIIGPIAGALVDRWNRKRIIVWTDAVRGLVMLAAAASALVWGTIPLAVVFATTVIVGASGVLFVPAVHSIMPDLVAASNIKRANSVRTAATQAANLAGSAVGAGLLALLGAPALFAANGITFLLSAVSEVPIRPRTHAPATSASIRQSVAEGFQFIRVQRGIRLVVIVQVAVNLLLPPIVVSLPFVLRDHWHIPESYFGFYFATVLAGSVVAFAALSASRASRRAESMAYRLGLPVLTLFLLLLAGLTLPGIAGSAMVQWLLFPLFALAGAAVGTLHLIGVTRIQHAVLPDQRGRVFAAVETVTAVLLPAVYALSGIGAELLRDRPGLLYLAVCVAATAISISVLRRRPLLRMRESE